MRLRSAETLRALMRQQNLSLGALASAAQCSKSFVSHLLSGRRNSCTDELASRIAWALDVPVHVLFVPSKSISDRQAAHRRLPSATSESDPSGYQTDASGGDRRAGPPEQRARFASRCAWVTQRVLSGGRGTAVGWLTSSLHRRPPGSPARIAAGITSPVPEVARNATAKP
jgi:transcriptional regulator with XRE-family HTH domain